MNYAYAQAALILSPFVFLAIYYVATKDKQIKRDVNAIMKDIKAASKVSKGEK